MERIVAIKGETPASFTLVGPSVVFGGEDLTGEWFTKETDYWLDRLGSAKPLLYDHSFNKDLDLTMLGVAELKADDEGIWFRAEIDKARKYAERIRQLAEGKLLGASTGAVAHLVRREGKWIKSWPIAEQSLTVMPAEPRTIDLLELRSLAAISAPLRTLLSDGAKAAWDTAYVNDLADSCFAHIEPGGKKDKEGKTTPRELRHFPYKDDAGKLDEDHIRDALGRIPQSDLPKAAKDKALAVVRRAARKVGIEVAGAAKHYGPMPGSDEARREAVQAAIWRELGGDVFISDTFADYVYACDAGYDDPGDMAGPTYWRVPYTIDGGAVDLGEPEAVEPTYQPVPGADATRSIAATKGAGAARSVAERAKRIGLELALFELSA